MDHRHPDHRVRSKATCGDRFRFGLYTTNNSPDNYIDGNTAHSQLHIVKLWERS